MPRALLQKRTVVTLAALAAVATLAWLAQNKLTFGLREVLPQRVYRSRQPDAADLERAVRDAGIASVVNLRGRQLDESWYVEELDASRELGLERLDVRFESHNWPRRYSLQRLVAFLDRAPEPVLLHCHGGTHRAGLASAVARALEGQPLSDVRAELSQIRTSLSMANLGYISKFFDLYEEWLHENGGSHDGETFRRWALEVYCPPAYDADVRIDRPLRLDRVPRGARLEFVAVATNLGAEPWQVGPEGVRLGVRVFGPHASVPDDPMLALSWDQSGIPLALIDGPQKTINRGESVEFEVVARAPDIPGHYVLQVDLIRLDLEYDETDWFSEIGKPGFVRGLEVVD